MAVTVPSTAKAGPSTKGLVTAMSQFILKVGEIKGLKGDIEKLKQEMKTKHERMAQFQKENQALQERVDKLKTRLRGKGLLQGAKHVIWDSIVIEAAKFRVYLNFISDKDSMAITSRSRCTVVNETLAKKPSEWAQNAINLFFHRRFES
jgi:cell division protein FtsB